MTLGVFLRLGYYFLARLLGRLLRRKSGLELFDENYADDRLVALSPADRAAQPSFSGCLACGLCDAHFDAYGRAARRDFLGPSELPLAYTRSLPDYDALTRYLTSLGRGDLRRLEQVCPARIPFTSLEAFATRSARALHKPVAHVTTPRKRHEPG